MYELRKFDVEGKSVKEVARMLFKAMEPEMRQVIREEIMDLQKTPAKNLPGAIVK